jgi:large subunit ribosomal protein L24
MENEMAKTRIKKEDLVVVISGKDRDLSKPRRVLQVIPSSGRVLVEGANMVKRHTRPNPQRNIKGGILEKESLLHISNVMPVDPETKKPTRVGSKMLEDGRRIRIAKRSGAPLDK